MAGGEDGEGEGVMVDLFSGFQHLPSPRPSPGGSIGYWALVYKV